MKNKLAVMLLSSLLVLSLSACEDVSTGTILDSEEDEQEIQTNESEESSETKELETEESQDEDHENNKEDADKSDTDTDTENGFEDSESIKVEGATNQNDAVPVEVGQEIDGTVSSKQWFSFTTGNDPNPKYQITITNKTSSSDRLDANLKKTSGDDICWTSAYSDGTSASMTVDKLDPDTTYDICISPHKDETIDFHMVIHDLTETTSDN